MRVETTVERCCLQCGAVFTTAVRRLKAGRGRFCSRRCVYASFPSAPLAERFWPKVDRSGECWLWLGAVDRRGYGTFSMGRRSDRRRGAHQVAYILTRGPIPPGLFVCHHCDNPPCVRPDHLFLGSHADNMRDASAKGRLHYHGPDNRGSRHGMAKLSESDVIAIRARRQAGESCREIAESIAMSPRTVLQIVRRELWPHVP